MILCISKNISIYSKVANKHKASFPMQAQKKYFYETERICWLRHCCRFHRRDFTEHTNLQTTDATQSKSKKLRVGTAKWELSRLTYGKRLIVANL